MNDHSSDPRQSPAPAEGAPEGLFAQLVTLLRALKGSRFRKKLGWLAAGIVVVICANTAGQLRLNVWQGAFYDALEQKQVPAFAVQLLVFAAIIAVLLALVVAQTWLQEMIKVRLREWLTHDLIDQWLVPKRAYLLGFAGQIGVNPDQRIHQDAQHLTELTTVLAIGLLAVVPAAGELRRRALGALGAGRVRVPRAHLHHPGLHGLVRARLLARRLAARLAGRPAADRAQRRALRARGRPPVRSRARQRVRRGHRDLWRRGRRAPHPRDRASARS